MSTASTVGAMTCGCLYVIACVGRPTGRRKEVIGDSRESAVFVDAMAVPNCIPLRYSSSLSSARTILRSGAPFTALAIGSLDKNLSTGHSLPRRVLVFARMVCAMHAISASAFAELELRSGRYCSKFVQCSASATIGLVTIARTRSVEVPVEHPHLGSNVLIVRPRSSMNTMLLFCPSRFKSLIGSNDAGGRRLFSARMSPRFSNGCSESASVSDHTVASLATGRQIPNRSIL